MAIETTTTTTTTTKLSSLPPPIFSPVPALIVSRNSHWSTNKEDKNIYIYRKTDRERERVRYYEPLDLFRPVVQFSVRGNKMFPPSFIEIDFTAFNTRRGPPPPPFLSYGSTGIRGLICFRKLSAVNKGGRRCKNPW